MIFRLASSGADSGPRSGPRHVHQVRTSAAIVVRHILNPGAAAEAMVTDFRKLLDAVAERAGWKAGEIRGKMFRHTYCAARLQTLDNGAAVSVFTVGRELGHGGDTMVKQVYGHLGDVRHRSAVVEYRFQKHAAILKARLEALRSKVGCANLARKAAGVAA